MCSIDLRKLLVIFLLGYPGKSFYAQSVTIINKNKSPFLEIRNGLFGLVVPKENTLDLRNPKKALAPIQSVIYKDGTYSNDSAVYLQSEVAPTSMQVTILENKKQEVILSIAYTFNKPQYVYGKLTFNGADAGPGYFKTTITVKQNSRSALIEEESDYDVSYEFKVSNGLHPDQARYRGWSSTAVENGYEPSGISYRKEEQRPPLDATVDLHFTKEKVYPFLSLWDISGGEINTGRYWQVYNSVAGTNSNLIGFFQGRASQLIGAKAVGPRLITSTDGKAFIQVLLARRAPDNSWYPKKRFQWGLFVSTKADLLPPDQYQPIGREMNHVSGIATRLDDYASKPAIIIPAFFEGAIYMSADKIQQLIQRVKKEDAFRYKINAIDPYFKPVTDAWRFPDSVRSTIQSFIHYGQELKNIFTNGDGVHDLNTQYWKGAFRFKRMALNISCLFADKTIRMEEAKKDSLMAVIRMMARIEWDDDDVPFFENTGVNFGPANMAFQYKNNGRDFFAMLFAKDPEFKVRSNQVYDATRNDVVSAIYENGITFGSPHYTQPTIDPILFTMLQLKNAGIGDLFKEQKGRLNKFIDFYSSLLTPPSVRFAGNRKLISFGDGCEESAMTFGLLASGFEDIDPGLSEKLYSIMQHGPPRMSLFGIVPLAMDLEKNYPPEFISNTSNYPGYLSHLRAAVNTENETAVWILNGDTYSDHRNDDRGEISIYALKAPLSLSRNCLYSPQANDERIRSVVIPAEVFPEWNKANQPISTLTSKGLVWYNSGQLEFAKLANSFLSVSKMTTKQNEWYRRVMMITLKEDQPVIIFYDSLNNDKDNIWSMTFMSEGNVNSTAGSITPIERIYNNSTLKQLPEATPEKTLTNGLNEFSFTGQIWPKKMHSTGGINWDLYSVTGNPSSFTLSQWTNTWENSTEVAEFLQTTGKPYSETQQILRIKNNAPFFHVLLPYFKGSEPYKNNVRLMAPGKLAIKYGNGELVLTPFYYYYSGADKIAVTAFTQEPFSEKGITVSGGITEIEIIENDVKIRVHGNSGKRMITLPFIVNAEAKNAEVQLLSKKNSSQIIINYVSKGMDLASNADGYMEYDFKKK